MIAELSILIGDDTVEALAKLAAVTAQMPESETPLTRFSTLVLMGLREYSAKAEDDGSNAVVYVPEAILKGFK